jgi:hypothetical protein
MYDVTMRSVSVTIVSVGKKGITYYDSVPVFLSQLSSMQSACALLYCNMWLLRLYHILPHYLAKGTICGGSHEHKMCVLIFIQLFV